MIDHHMPQTPCPACKHGLDGASPFDQKELEPPRPGDYSVCMYCATPLQYKDDMTFKVADLDGATVDQIMELLKMRNIVLQSQWIKKVGL